MVALLDRRYAVALIVVAVLIALAALWAGHARIPGKRVPDKAQLVYGEGGIRWQP